MVIQVSSCVSATLQVRCVGTQFDLKTKQVAEKVGDLQNRVLHALQLRQARNTRRTRDEVLHFVRASSCFGKLSGLRLMMFMSMGPIKCQAGGAAQSSEVSYVSQTKTQTLSSYRA